jgi:hypothetical protein
VTRDDGGPVFPVAASVGGEPVAFVAGDPEAHRQVLAEIAGTVPAGVR